MTLDAAIDKFLSQRRGTLKESTVSDYRKVLRRNLAGWMDKPITDINRECRLKPRG